MSTGEALPRRAQLLKLHVADMGPEEEAAVLDVLRSGWLTKGPRTRQFEQDFALRVGAPFALGVNSCTAALHLALLAGGIGPGDEVIVPALTFAATANVVVHCGATPVFADVLPATHTIDPASVARLITPRTKALIPVHFAGIACDMAALSALAAEHGLFVVEDCAHAIETECGGKPAGVAQGSRFAAYSFYTTKNLICGEGGILTCADADDLARATVLGLHGMSADAWKRYSGAGFRLYDIVAAGYKYNMFELQAALGLVQLAKLDANWERRRARAAQYDALIAATFPDGAVTPLAYPPGGKPAYHLYVVRVNAGSTDILSVANQTDRMSVLPPAMPHASPFRDAVIHALRRRNVEAYLHYICLPDTTFYRERYGTSGAATPVALDLSRRSITLPLFPSMTEADVEYAVAMLKESVDEAKRLNILYPLDRSSNACYGKTTV